MPEEERAQADAALRVHEAVQAEIALVDRRLAKVALADERVERLMILSGMGPTTALSR